MIAALFVALDGVYYGLDDVDPWDEARDARTYAGPWPVVAHPPCERWGRYARGGPNPKARRREIGDDGGCFAAALAAVRRWGGVLEHPAASHAWAHHGLMSPPHRGGWVVADNVSGWTCHVEQGHYGHRARKATWLYINGCALPSLRWGPSRSGIRLDRGFHSREEREQHRRFMHPPADISQEEQAARRAYLEKLGARACPEQRMGKRERTATPIPFRDLLLSIARTRL